jgi:hypothetical protein
MRIRSFFSLLAGAAVIAMSVASNAAVVVNEVLANEPSSATSLEWIELFNPSMDAVPLDGFYLLVGDRRIDLPPADTIVDSGYYIICRKLLSPDGTPSFESVWGNNSGVWGDDECEDGFPPPHEGIFSLPNTAGAVELCDAADSVLSRLEWSEAGSDGVSWERINCKADDIFQSIDQMGSTPGFLNSVTLLIRDLAIDSVYVFSSGGVTDLEVRVISRSLTPVSYASLFFTTRDSTTPGDADTLAFVTLPEIAPGGAYTVAGSFDLDGDYVPMSAMLSEDDRTRNNSVDFVAPGREFPSVILSEVMLIPVEETGGRWIELYNLSNGPCDISGWQLGDGSDIDIISSASLTIPPGDYAILAEDSSAFADGHPALLCLIAQPTGWPGFGSSCDTVRLVDSYGLEADRLVYCNDFDDGYSWSRRYDYDYADQWGRSAESGGTPGLENTVAVMPSGERVEISIERTHFTPDGDGTDDNLIIRTLAPPNDSYTLRIYDRQGRIVRTLFDNETYIPSDAVWDGCSDAGHRLPIGLYIVYFEAASFGSAKKAVVVAR